jgi:hypothetical protein
MLFHFCLDDTVVHPPTGGDKGPGREDARVQKPTIDVEEIFICERDVIDVALASRHGGAIERNDLCGLLTDRLEDVRLAILTVLPLLALLLNFDFSFLL